MKNLIALTVLSLIFASASSFAGITIPADSSFQIVNKEEAALIVQAVDTSLLSIGDFKCTSTGEWTNTWTAKDIKLNVDQYYEVARSLTEQPALKLSLVKESKSPKYTVYITTDSSKKNITRVLFVSKTLKPSLTVNAGTIVEPRYIQSTETAWIDYTDCKPATPSAPKN